MKRLFSKKTFLLSIFLFILITGNIFAQSYVKTSKKIYAKTDTVVFKYKYSGKWESVWLIVDPVKGKGDHMTTAADLGSNPDVRKFAGRFGPGSYKAKLVGNSENGAIVKELASCSFEIKENRIKLSFKNKHLN
jgi:hypothetical protein